MTFCIYVVYCMWFALNDINCLNKYPQQKYRISWPPSVDDIHGRYSSTPISHCKWYDCEMYLKNSIFICRLHAVERSVCVSSSAHSLYVYTQLDWKSEFPCTPCVFLKLTRKSIHCHRDFVTSFLFCPFFFLFFVTVLRFLPNNLCVSLNQNTLR